MASFTKKSEILWLIIGTLDLLCTQGKYFRMVSRSGDLRGACVDFGWDFDDSEEDFSKGSADEGEKDIFMESESDD